MPKGTAGTKFHATVLGITYSETTDYQMYVVSLGSIDNANITVSTIVVISNDDKDSVAAWVRNHGFDGIISITPMKQMIETSIMGIETGKIDPFGVLDGKAMKL